MHFDRLKRLHIKFAACIAWSLIWTTPSPAQAATHFLDNGLVRVGVSDLFGGAIEYLADSNGPGSPGKNYINRHDAGRLAQYSYYGTPITGGGPNPTFDPWPWNPIQGGDVLGNTPGVQQLTNDGTTIYTRSQPLDWAKDNVRHDAIFETWITLEGRAVRIQSQVTNDSVDRSFWREQEVPAVYVTSDLENFKTYTGNSPFTGGAVTTEQIDQLANNQVDFVRPTEYWSAWVDNNDFGVGVFTQDVQHQVAFRSGAQGVSGDFANETNYLAPAPKFTVGPNMVDTSVSYLMLDTVSGIRSLAESKAVYPSVGKWEFNEANNRERWGILNANDVAVAAGNWSFDTSLADPTLLSPQFQVPAGDYTQVEIRMSATNAPDTLGQFFWNRLADAPFEFSPLRQQTFTVIPDGQMHTYTFDLSNQIGWDGTITQLRFDPTANGNNTNYAIDYIRVFDPSFVPPPERIAVNTLSPLGATLGNGGANNGFVSILGDDSQNTLTMTAAGSNGTPGIDNSSQNGLIVRQNAGDEWLNNGEYFDVVFSLDGPHSGFDIIKLVGGDFGWFNNDFNATALFDADENVDLILDPDGAATLLGSIGFADAISHLGGSTFVSTSIDIPLGQTIRFSVRNGDADSSGGFNWPEDAWLIRELVFETVDTRPGDVDSDGDVDQDDLLAWQIGFGIITGAAPTDGDADGDGDVDGNDFLVWQRNFGAAAIVATASQVPEPATGLLVLVALSLSSVESFSRSQRFFSDADVQ